MFGSPTSTLICSDEVRKRPAAYNEGNQHCDIELCFDILRNRDFGFVHQVLTFTRDHAESQTAFSQRFGTDYLGTLEHLTKYGRAYLSEQELDQCFRRSWRQYYKFLAAKLLHGSDDGFWKFHQTELARLGLRLTYGKMAKPVMAELFDLVLNPLKTVMRIAKKLSR